MLLQNVSQEVNSCHAPVSKSCTAVQIQHLQAQVELLEADSAGRHTADSRPGSPREPEADKLASHMEPLQADNARLQHQVTVLLFVQHTPCELVRGMQMRPTNADVPVSTVTDFCQVLRHAVVSSHLCSAEGSSLIHTPAWLM